MGHGYRIPLALTKEMRIGLTKLAAKESSPTDFSQALKMMRAGMIVYDMLSNQDLQAMYLRKLILDDEAEFLLKSGLVSEDFRPVKVEKIHQANELRLLHNTFNDAFECWEGLMPKTKTYWIREAKKYPDISSARKLLEVKQV